MDASSFRTAERIYYRLENDDPRRADLRSKLVRHLIGVADSAVAADEYDAVVEQLAHITSLYLPHELEKGIPQELGKLATYLRKEGEQRGDEGRVLSALWIQKTLAPQNPEPSEQYAMLRRWSDEARQNLGGAIEHFNGLIEVIELHAKLSPAPEVLATLADLYIERRKKLVAMLGPDGQSPPSPGDFSFQDYREATAALGQAPLDLAAVYLAHDDYERALSRLRQLETVTGLEPRIRAVVEFVVADRAEASDAVLVLARAYLEGGERQDVAADLCRYGVRHFSKDARFPQCLAQIAASRDDYVDAGLEYEEAIRLAPTQKDLYDEALEVLANLMRGELFDGDPVEARLLAERARGILKASTERWPGALPPVSFDELELAVGLAEMNAGNAEDARVHFEASLKKKETTAALIQLGQLSARTGKREEASRFFKRALDRTSAKNADDLRQRALILEQMGDVARAANQAEEARRAYAESLSLWEGSAGAAEDAPSRALAQIRRGVLLSRLGRGKEANDAFEQAMQIAPEHREVYAQILSFLVVSAPSTDLSESVLRRAQRELTLDPDWKTYFAMWVKIIAARSHTGISHDTQQLLTRLARSDAWWGQLAQFGVGTISHEKLSAKANTKGERTEADFYEGARLLAAGDVAAARHLFVRVLSSQMVGFYEFQMAQELLLLGDAELVHPSQPSAQADAPIVR
jgi:tetratricopeptide (TPR) repeat protein